MELLNLGKRIAADRYGSISICSKIQTSSDLRLAPISCSGLYIKTTAQTRLISFTLHQRGGLWLIVQAQDWP